MAANNPANPQTPAPDASPNGWGGRRYLGLGFMTLVIFAGGFGSWATLTEISGAVIAPGALEVEGNRQIVQHPTGGVVAEISARNGDRVEAGAVLVKLDGERTRSELAIVEGQHLEVLARADRLAAERDGKKAVEFTEELARRGANEPAIRTLMDAELEQFEIRRASVEEEASALRERKAQISRQNEGLSAQAEATSRQKAIMARAVARQEDLFAQKIGTEPQVQDAQRELARLEGAEGQIAASLAENAARVAEIDIEILRLGSELREEAASTLRELEFREIELRERRRALEREVVELELRAPASGTVYGSTADTLRAVVRAAEPVMFVVPEAAPLVVRARIEPTRIADIRMGQEAVLRFSAFNARTTPEVKGKVVEVSADAIHDDQRGDSYYSVEIELTEAATTALEAHDLLPGMPVEAFISTEARSPASYLMKPISDYLTKAMRET